MAAIIPFLENPDDPSETKINEREFNLTPAQSARGGTVEEPRIKRALVVLQGLSDPPRRVSSLPELAIDDLTSATLDQSHAELTSTTWIRNVVMDQLIGRKYTVVRTTTDTGQQETHLEMDRVLVKPGETVLAWNPPASPTARRFKVLSWTSKMAAPSFSLPAGAPQTGGSCPGAIGGQSVVPVEELLAGARFVRAVTGQAVRLQQTICGVCYATGGQYATSQVQFAQALRFAWARDAAADVTRNGSTRLYVFGPKAKMWVEVMVEAINNANFYLDGREKKGEDGAPTTTLLPERHQGRFFRIHDSGDFFNAGYLAMWKAVAARLPDIRFWAPSRIWATSWGVAAVDEINGPAEQSNLIIRPSAYHMNEGPPPRKNLGIGWSDGSSAVKDTLKGWAGAAKVFDWDCRTYAIKDKKLSAKHTCRHAEAPMADGITPSGKLGCRACWLHPNKRINYTVH